jgi:exodeoxyribonuclease VII large subunit
MSFAAGADTIVDFTRDIWTVSRLNSEVRAVLDGSFPLLWVQGELSNLSQPASGHIYFTLKDEAAQVRCAMFRFKRRLLQFKPANGEVVLVRAGEGALRVELERLKQRLAAEGLFDEGKKRPLPSFPSQVGLITSASGAALHDLLTVLRRRLPLLPVLIYPAQVQGEGAAATLIDALELANRRADCDLLILARGGGSLEDLMAFNDEGLARAIRASAIPVVTGIGHEIDISIADLAADRRGATPSAAAELATPSAEHLAQRLQALQRRLPAAERRILEALRRKLEHAGRQLRLLHPMARLEQLSQKLDGLEARIRTTLSVRVARAQATLRSQRDRLLRATPLRYVESEGRSLRALHLRLERAVTHRVSARSERLASIARRLDALSPLSTLARGYSIVTLEATGELVRDATTVPDGARINVKCWRGQLVARVEASSD